MPQFTIRDPETVRLVREAAQREGKTMTAIVIEALRASLERVREQKAAEERIQYRHAYGKRMRETADPDWLARDQIAELYNEKSGLPK